MLFSVYSGTAGTARIAVQSLETGARQVLEAGTYLHYASTGHIVFEQANSLWAVPFDADRLVVTGEAKPVLEGVPEVNPAGIANFALSTEGTLVYVPGTVGGNRFVWVDRQGNEQPVGGEPRNYAEFSLSPDGAQVAVHVGGSDDDVWVYDLARDVSTRLTFDPAGERNPLWSPDGRKVAFGGTDGMFWKAADGTGEVEPIVESPGNQRPEAFSQDGSVLVFQDLSSGRHLGMVSLDGQAGSPLLWNSESFEYNAAISPDGRYIAYQSTESGQAEIFVRPFPNVNDGKWQISNDSGTWPLWAPDGRELFYLSRQELELAGVLVETEPTFTLGRRESLFDTSPYVTNTTARRIAISPDGQRFLLLKSAGESEDTEPPSIIVVQNWHEELKRLVPTN